jgi:hypothetical protein
MKRSTGRRRIALLTVALVALSIGVSVGLAKSGPTQINSTLHLRQNNLCPLPGEKLKVARGTVQINNDKGHWRIVVHLRGAIPGEYHLDLQDASCNQFKTGLSKFKVGSDGSGDTSTDYFASGFQSFYLRAHGPTSYFTPLLWVGGNP